MDILISAASAMQPAPAGQVTLFINTENNGILSYIDSLGVVKVYNGFTGSTDLENCCSCELAKKWMDAVTCGLKNGTLSVTEFGTLTAAGLLVTAIESINPSTGAKTCTVEVGQRPAGIPVTSIVVTSPGPLYTGGTKQAFAAVLPIDATNQNLVWVSGNPAVATVSQAGLVSGITVGTTIIYAYSQSNPSVFGSVSVTVTVFAP